ncbi:MAG: hypothetical protein ABW223_11370 [Rariglobus sp.]
MQQSFETFAPNLTKPGSFKSAPLKLNLEQTPKFNPHKKTFDFEIKLGTATFSTFEELKAAITVLPKGSEITWAPSCCLVGDEPLHAHQNDLKSHCDTLEMILVVRPSG